MKGIINVFFAVLISIGVRAQNQAEVFIKEAQDFLTKKEYKQAQLSLQDAINDINMLLAQQVAELLPAEINGLKSDADGEVNSSGMGMIGGGLQVTKRYQNQAKPENYAEVQIIANSPMLATMNMYLTNPGMLGAGYKSVRVGSTRAIMMTDLQDAEDNAKIRSTEIQIPLGQTMITIQAIGFAAEQDELSFAAKLDLEKIRATLGE